MRLVVLSAFALLLVLSGCGGEGEEPAAAAPQSPKARFVGQADAICGRLAKETEALADTTFADLSTPPTPTLQAEYERKATALQRAGLTELRALTPPPGDEAQVAELLAALEATLAELAAAPLDQPGTPGGAPQRFERLARGYGLQVCGGTA